LMSVRRVGKRRAITPIRFVAHPNRLTLRTYTTVAVAFGLRRST